MRLLTTILLLLIGLSLTAQHPISFFTKAEAAEVKKDLTRYPLLTRSFNEIKSEVDAWIGKDVDVPFPKDAAGGYTHDRHKANYMLMFNSGILYNLTGDARYARFVKDILLKYAALNPKLGKHPQATSSSPGHIFWQALNDANWLVYSGMAYDLIVNTLSSSEKDIIVKGAFEPEVKYFTTDLRTWFDLIHNHGVWACAGVGIVGIATDNKDYVEMALYGTKKDGKSGFIAQMNGLFSPDGYYTEGPYYVRYAILPYYLFANALDHARPALNIFQHRNSILHKALLSCLQLTNLDGAFFPLNDALKEKDYTSNELVTAINIAWNEYGKNDGLLVVANKQDRVMLNKGGASIAKELAIRKSLPKYFPYKTVEYKDGVEGNEGGVTVLRSGSNDNLTSLIYKYTSHGLSHGHFDKLNFNLYDKGNEIITDYGSVRFIGVEQKYGGRYLPENDKYAGQTIAHNTIVVDESSHFGGNEKEGEKHHGDKIFSKIDQPNAQVVSATAKTIGKDVSLIRTLYLIQIPGSNKLVVDIFSVNSSSDHQYDLPFHYNGHLIKTSFPYTSFSKKQETLGAKNGYEYLWKEAETQVKDTITQLTFLNDRSYYTVSSLIEGPATVFLTRTGASDPNFNLRHEPGMVIRRNGSRETYLNVVEIHGSFDPVKEFSTNAYPLVRDMKLLKNDNYTVARIAFGSKELVIAQANNNTAENMSHTAFGIDWKGPCIIMYDGKKL